MTNTVIQLRHSTVGGNTPLTLANGELALNSYDGVIYYAGPDGNIIGFDPWPGPSGSGHEIQFNDFGTLGAHPGLTYYKTANQLSVYGIVYSNTALVSNGYIEFGDGSKQYTANAGSGGTDQWVRDTANAAFDTANSAAIAANTPSYVANSAAIYANGAFAKANSLALTVSLTDDSNNYTNVVSNITGIRFDANSGFDITDLGSGNVKVGMNSTFKTWKITGQSDLIANGLDTIEFVGSNGVVITSNTLAVPKTITFDTSQIFNTVNAVAIAANTPSHVANSASVYANSAFSAANSANTLYVSDIPPNSPTANTLWWQSNTATLKIYYNDGTSSQWVDTNQSYPVDNLARIRANAAFDAANSAIANTGVDIWARGQSNAAFIVANSAAIAANTPSDVANSAAIAANTPSHVANSASVYANGSFDVANSAAIAANTPSHVANSASVYANSAFEVANAAAIAANTPSHVANSASIYANAAFEVANSAAIAANTPSSVANSSFIQANAAFIVANNAFTYANGTIAWNTANAAFDAANNALDTWVRGQANSAFIQANSAFAVANAAFTTANGTIAWDTANAAFIQANTGLIHAQSAFSVVNSTAIAANTPSHVANSASVYANGAFAVANNEAGVNLTQNNSIDAAFVAANSAGVYANGAFTRANNSLNANTGGTITGDLSITGNLSVLGNSFSISATTLIANDTVIVLGANNYTSDLLDIGFAAHYNDTVNAHTGFIRDSGTKEWQLFEGYTPEIGANNQIDINDPSFKIATLNANLHSTKILVKGIDLLPYVNNAYSTANSAFIAANNESGVNATQNNSIDAAFVAANSSGSYANSAFLAANTADSKAVSAGSYANSAFLQANTPSDVANSASIYANGAFSAANTADSKATSAGIYANGAFAVANNEAGVNATQNTNIQYAWNHANAAFLQANTGGSGVRIDVYNANTNVFTATANGTGTTFDLGFAPASQNNIIVSSNGIVQYDYTLSTSTLVFNTAPPNGALIRIQTFGTSQSNSLSGIFANGNLIIYDGNTLVSLANTNTAGTYGNSTHVPVITTDEYGRVLSVTNTSISGLGASDQYARDSANASFIQANSAITHAQSAFDVANSAAIAANTPSHVANSASVYANGAFSAANTADDKATSAGIYANGAFSAANNEAGVNATQNTNIQFAWNHANAAFNEANTGGSGVRINVYNANTNVFQQTANGTGTTFELGFSPASQNSVIVTANGVVQYDYTVANSTLILNFTPTVGTNVRVQTFGTSQSNSLVGIFETGNLIIYDGNTLVSLANTNAPGTYGNSTHIPVITTDSYGRIITVTNTAISGISAIDQYARDTANIAFVEANDAFYFANVAWDAANAAHTDANAAFLIANAAFTTANGTIAWNTANAAFNAANNEAGVNSTQNTTIQLAWNHANAAYNQANTGGGGASVSVGDDPPAAPTANSLWWQSNTGELKIYYNDGTSSQWVDAFSSAYSLDQWARDHANAAFIQANTGGGGGASVSVSDSPPVSPTANSLWWQSNTATLKIYYSDGTSNQWVDASPSAYALDQAARDTANASFLVANSAFTTANGTIAWNTANAAFNTANTVSNTGTAAFAAANTSSNTFMIFAVSDENTAITMGGGKTRFRAPFGMTIYQIPRASLNTASSSGDVVIDINENGSSILGVDKLTIDAGEKTSTSAAVPTTLATTTIADDSEITIDIDSAGTNANGLKVTLYFRRT